MLRFYFSQHIRLRSGFIDLFPEKQWLFVCPDVIPRSWTAWLLFPGVYGLFGVYGLQFWLERQDCAQLLHFMGEPN